MEINVDLDGVLGRNAELMCNYIRENYPINISPKSITEYNFKISEINMSAGDIVQEIYRENPNFILNMNTVENSIKNLRRIKQEEHSIRIVTHRPSTVREETLEWVNSRDIPYDDIVINAPKDKSKIKGDIIIDDNPEVISDFQNCDTVSILFPRTYNSDFSKNFAYFPEEHVNQEREYIINTWSQWDIIYKIINKIQKEEKHLH